MGKTECANVAGAASCLLLFFETIAVAFTASGQPIISLEEDCSEVINVALGVSVRLAADRFLVLLFAQQS